jgi:SAM-dependent methyltransferase
VNISNKLRSRLVRPAFPRASTYDAEWLFDTMMGPNVLWLAEWASHAVPLHRGMRILDLGCGKAASSIFLAQEFDVMVWAADLWIKPSENWHRIEAAGLADRVLPLHAEAHALPFAEGYFDAIVSFDAYHYFGTDDLYVGYISKFIRPGGYLCIAVPGLAEELPEGPPEKLRPYWDWDFCSFHSANGGAGIGPKPGGSRSSAPTPWQTGGGCGRNGTSGAQRPGLVAGFCERLRGCAWTAGRPSRLPRSLRSDRADRGEAVLLG